MTPPFDQASADPRTIGTILDLAVRACPERLAVTLGEKALSFRTLDRQANAMARALQALGLRRGDRLVFWSPISLDAVVVFVATQRLGVAFCPIKDLFGIEEALPLVSYLRCQLLVAGGGLADKAHAVAQASGARLALIGTGLPGDLTDLAAAASDAALSHEIVDGEDVHAIFLTSGSTGEPKGVMVSHRASWNRSYFGNARSATMGGRGDINMFPLFHWAGWHFMLCAWIHGRPSHMTTGADAESLTGLIDRWHPSYMYAIPAIWERVLEHRGSFETRSLRWAGTGTYRVEPSLVEALRARFARASLTIGWGATELGVGLQIDDDDIDARPYSVGLPAPGNAFRLIDGELWGRSEQMMSGYFDLPEATAEVMQGGWYRTGDLAERDADGYYTITGRAREVIRSAAETIAPAEVEAAIRLHPGVRDVSVVGLPDVRWGETVCAALIVEEGHPVPEVADLRAFLAPRLAPFKHPRRIVTLAELPRTAATGQIQRSAVRAMILEREPATG